MIAYLEGTVLRRDEESCVLLTAGAWPSAPFDHGRLAALPGAGDTARLFVHTLVREDALTLFAFSPGKSGRPL